MADNKLEIIISGENKGALSSIDAVTDALDKLPASTGKASAGLQKLEKSIGPIVPAFTRLKTAAGSAQAVFNNATLGGAKLATGMGKTAPAIEKTNKQLEGTNKAGNSAALALRDLGRVAQDAPFGFIGISNNLNPLLESFQRLKAESGSSGAALKALGGSLLGAGGIGLALSAITAAITFAQMGFRAWGGSAKDTASDIDELKTSIADFSKTANEFAGSQLAEAQSLIAATQNVSLSLKERGQAVDDLQKKFPAYFGSLKDEDILAGKLGNSYEKLKNDILAAARARAAQDILGKLAAQELSILERRNEVQAKLTNETSKYKKEQDLLNSVLKKSGDLAPEVRTIAEAFGLANQAVGAFTSVDLQKDLKEINKELTDLGSTQQKYTKYVDEGAGATIRLDQSLNEITDKKGKDFSDFVEKLRIDLQGLQAQESGDTFAKIKESTAELTNSFLKLKQDGKLTAKDIIDAPGIIAEIEKAKSEILSTKLFDEAQTASAKSSAENWAAVYKFALDKALSNIVPEIPQLDAQDYLRSMQTMLAGIEKLASESMFRTKKQMDELASGATAIIQAMAVDLVGGLAEGIGNALSGVGNPFNSILKVLGDGLVTLGKFVLQSFITLEALKKVLAAANIQPALGIVIGAAMIALGTVIRNKVSQTKFAEGGIVSGPMSAAIGEAGQSEVVMPLSRLSSIMRGNNGAGQVVFQISGQNLIGVLNRGTASLNRTFR